MFLTFDKHHPISVKDKALYAKMLKTFNTYLKQYITTDEMAFAQLPSDTKVIAEVTKVATHIKKNFSTVVIIGIGGSDLGARACLQALTNQYTQKTKIYFAGDTTDPTPLTELHGILDYKKTAFIVISKSGGTIETLSTLAFFLKESKKKNGSKTNKHFFTITSKAGELYSITQKEKFTHLLHGPVGGRFSVLSNVGLLPCAIAGIDIKDLLAGAKSCVKLMQENNLSKNSAFSYALTHYLASKKGKNIHVLMPYSAKLSLFTKWFVQLWGESLGKKGKGTTPVAAIGPTDQHSLLQLLQDGPNDKTITFITIQQGNTVTVPSLSAGADVLMKNTRYTNILNAEYEGTKQALTNAKKQTCTLTLPKLDAYNFGFLLFFFQLTTVYTSLLMNVYPFDQPGVEASKIITKKLLAKR